MPKRIKMYQVIIITLIMSVIFGVAGHFVGVSIKQSAIPPENPPYPAESAEDYERFDNDTKAVMNESECVLTYTDGTTKTAVRCSDSDIRFLNKHLDDAKISWINLHTGTCLIVYTIEHDGTTYEYYQHLVDSEYVFIYKE